MSAMSKIKCPECGAEMPVNRMYCDECGAQLEHDLNEVQAAVDHEVRYERIKSISRTVRWFLAASLVLVIGGCYFRKAYRDLLPNDIVCYATAPTVSIDEEASAETDQFGVLLPEPKTEAAPQPVEQGDIDARLIQQALARATVSIRKRGAPEPMQAILVGDVVLFVRPRDAKEPVPVHTAGIRRIRPLGKNRWEITSSALKEPVVATFEKPDKVLFHILERRPDGKEVRQTIRLDEIQELKPL